MLFALSFEIARMSDLQWYNVLMECCNLTKKHLHVNDITMKEEREEKNIKKLLLSRIFVTTLC